MLSPSPLSISFPTKSTNLCSNRSNKKSQETIDDPIWGKVTIDEPVLIALLHSNAIARLHNVLQHGITALIGLTEPPVITRRDHSVGAMLLVRHLGGSLKAQAAALLHDISHTALSHVMDSAFGYVVHEKDKIEFVNSTDIIPILEAHFDKPLDILHEELYPLLERDKPKLCADRTDYGLRDSLSFGFLTPEQVASIRSDLIVYNEEICCRSPSWAKTMALAYLESDKAAWANPKHSCLYKLAGIAINLAFKHKVIDKKDIWEFSGDRIFWDRLVHSNVEEVRSAAIKVRPDIIITQLLNGEQLDTDELSQGRSEIIEKSTQYRFVDPDVIVQWGQNGEPIASKRLSELDEDYARTIVAYEAAMKGKKRFKIVWPISTNGQI